MKIKKVISSFLFVALISTPLWADEISTSECMKFASGTWTNNEYRNQNQWGKIIQHENGRRDDYFEATDTQTAVGGGGDIIINEAWTDEDGSI